MSAVLNVLGTTLSSIPSDCVVCTQPVAQDNLCALCIDELPRLTGVCHRCALPVSLGTLCGPCLLKPPAWHAMICAVPYSEPFDTLMAGFKFQGRTEIATALSALLVEAINERPITSIFASRNESALKLPNMLVPVPLHWTRLWKRGFNQAAVLSKPIGKIFDIAVVNALTRTRKTQAQTLISSGKRRANLSNAFRTRCSVKGLHVALVDDVVTSGATATAATTTLLQAGAQSVQVWACVRAKGRHPTKPLRRPAKKTPTARQKNHC